MVSFFVVNFASALSFFILDSNYEEVLLREVDNLVSLRNYDYNSVKYLMPTYERKFIHNELYEQKMKEKSEYDKIKNP